MKKRLEKLYETMDNDVTCCVITKPENIYYFSGFYPTQISFAIIPFKGGSKLFVTPIDFKGAEEKSTFEVIELKSKIFENVKDNIEKVRRGNGSPFKSFLKKLSYRKYIGIEEDFLNIRTLKNLGISEKKYKDISTPIMKLRSIKDSEEIENIKKTIEIAERSLKEVAESIQAGMTEKE
ncbi:MAG: aminopeptidase P family N-terminal domain-containing protein, partial [Euryarchaeota archaeon]|nr:aminopeptidase P family N-terminal domain-containing protein [Euryarchaeota archaeon]